MPGRELVYHDGHYHRSADRPEQRHDQKRPQQNGLLQKTHDAWGRVLYGVGNAYYKIRGHWTTTTMTTHIRERNEIDDRKHPTSHRRKLLPTVRPPVNKIKLCDGVCWTTISDDDRQCPSADQGGKNNEPSKNTTIKLISNASRTRDNFMDPLMGAKASMLCFTLVSEYDGSRNQPANRSEIQCQGQEWHTSKTWDKETNRAEVEERYVILERGY